VQALQASQDFRVIPVIPANQVHLDHRDLLDLRGHRAFLVTQALRASQVTLDYQVSQASQGHAVLKGLLVFRQERP